MVLIFNQQQQVDVNSLYTSRTTSYYISVISSENLDISTKKQNIKNFNIPDKNIAMAMTCTSVAAAKYDIWSLPLNSTNFK